MADHQARLSCTDFGMKWKAWSLGYLDMNVVKGGSEERVSVNTGDVLDSSMN